MNFWQKMYGAKRAAIDRKLLASMEREIANEEKLRAFTERKKPPPMDWRPVFDMDTTEQISDEERARIARAFGRPG